MEEAICLRRMMRSWDGCLIDKETEGRHNECIRSDHRNISFSTDDRLTEK